MLNKIKENYISSLIYFPFILIADLVIYFGLLFIDNSAYSHLIPLIVSLLISNIFLAYKLGERRIKELNSIKEIIRFIRKNELKHTDDISLGNNLKELETEIKKMFVRTQDDIASMKKLEQARTEFLGNVSHELRTPIFAIQGYIETLLSGAIHDENVNTGFLEKANHHTHNLNNLLNDLIDISMIESGQMRMSFRYFPFGEFIESLIKDFIPMAGEKGLEFVYKPVRSDLMLFGDKERLRQVFVNLITNAIKYTEKGKVEILVEEEEKLAEITVRDTGIGIPEKDLPRVFERFYRIDKVRSREVGGTGLGLAIVKHIVEAHGSKVSVTSKVRLGSEFSFKLKK
jgi:two-component system, OmpR family, phosphate regulon sensor histidine kinase PhoR